MTGNIYSRQNDKIAIMYRKAAKLVYARERFFKTFVIAVSVLLCITSILNRYLLKIFPDITFFSDNQVEISEWLSLVSGFFIIIQIGLGRYTNRMHIEGVGFEERFDNHVFAMRPNKMIMRPVSDTIIENYASRVRRADEFFTNAYFSSASETFDRTAQFKHYKRYFEREYRLMLNVKGFFQTIWVGFIVAVFIIALSFDDMFIATLISILIPSLSIISLIFSSWYSFGKQTNYLQNALNIIEDLSEKATFGEDSPESLNNPTILRAMQDCLYNQRMNSFDIPQFLVRIYSKRMRVQSTPKNFDKVVEHTKSLVPVTFDSAVNNVKRADNAIKAKFALKFDESEVALDEERGVVRTVEIAEKPKPTKKSAKGSARAKPSSVKGAGEAGVKSNKEADTKRSAKVEEKPAKKDGKKMKEESEKPAIERKPSVKQERKVDSPKPPLTPPVIKGGSNKPRK